MKRTDAVALSRGSAGVQNIAVSTTSAASAAINHNEALLYSDVEVFAVTGDSPTATVNDGTPIPANQLVRVHGITPGQEIAFITATGTGTVRIRPGA